MIVGLDFETENVGDECRPLICALDSAEWNRVYDFSIREDYVDFIIELVTSGDKYVVFNASFDVEIILIMLLRNEFVFLGNEDKPINKSIEMLMGQKIYSVKTYFEVYGKLVSSQFVDLGNLIVGESLKDIAKAFTDLEKGDYEASKDNMDEFKEYCLLDAKVTRIAYENISKQLGKEYLTIGGASFNTFLNMSFEGKSRETKFNAFKKLYGDNDLEEDKYLRKWYAGGFGWSSTEERTEIRVHSYDIKSAYPHGCYGKLPTTNNKITCKGLREPNEDYPFAFVKLRVTGQIKKDHAPILPSRNIYGDSNIYIYDDKEVHLIREYGVKDEYDFFMENIEIDIIDYVETILMQSCKTNPIEKFMDEFYQMKNTSTGIKRDYAKRILNSFTGKLGTNPVKENSKYIIDERNKLIKDGSEDVEIDTYAVHVISVITSRTRCKCYTIDSMIRGKVKFRMYATDSVKHSTEVQVIESSTELGAWEIEKENIEFIFLGLKAYIFDPNNERGKREVVCAGISRAYKKLITNEQFYAGTRVPSLISARASNGRVIYEGFKRIASSVRKPRRR